jgi:hypothetical protein
LLEQAVALDGEHLLSFVSRGEGRALGRGLARAVAEERSAVVALIGKPKTGKTRCVVEVLCMRVPQALVFAPHRNPEALREVVGHRRFRSPKHWSVLALPRVVVGITAGARWGIERLGHAPTLVRLTPQDGEDGKRIASLPGEALAAEVGRKVLVPPVSPVPELLDIHDSGRHPSSEGGQAVPEGAIVVECLIAAARLGLR